MSMDGTSKIQSVPVNWVGKAVTDVSYDLEMVSTIDASTRNGEAPRKGGSYGELVVIVFGVHAGTRTKPALVIQEHWRGFCVTVSNAKSNLTWYWGETLPELRSITRATLRACNGDLPRYIPTFARDFHLWNGRRD